MTSDQSCDCTRPCGKCLTRVYWVITLALLAALVLTVVFITPVESTMGVVQKIFYLHLPVALSAFAAAFIVFIASLGYLFQRSMWWDDLAAAAGHTALLFCGVLLLTGMFWARAAWGAWWTFSPRLTLSLVLFLLYVVYVLIRPAIHSPQRRAMVSAVYGVVAFLDVPLVYLSTKLMPDVHPTSISLAPAMRYTLLFAFLPVLMLMGGLVSARYRLNRQVRALHEEQLRSAPRPSSAAVPARSTPPTPPTPPAPILNPKLGGMA